MEEDNICVYVCIKTQKETENSRKMGRRLHQAFCKSIKWMKKLPTFLTLKKFILKPTTKYAPDWETLNPDNSKALLYINVKQCESKTIDQSDKQVVMKQS
jgi:hypothetical protein